MTQKHRQAAARHWKFDIIGTDSFGVKPDDHATLVTVLKQFTIESRHPELEHAPFLFVGMSAGGGMSIHTCNFGFCGWPEHHDEHEAALIRDGSVEVCPRIGLPKAAVSGSCGTGKVSAVGKR